MDIASLATGMAQSGLMSKVSTQVLKNAMDMQEIAGNGLIKMMDAASVAQMERSVNPHIGSNFDMMV
ncbi:MAG: putative motility protein [Lachnospiraceae bacterium]|nr:putative motility protein [Lachnospiraceae bacterium]